MEYISLFISILVLWLGYVCLKKIYNLTVLSVAGRLIIGFCFMLIYSLVISFIIKLLPGIHLSVSFYGSVILLSIGIIAYLVLFKEKILKRQNPGYLKHELQYLGKWLLIFSTGLLSFFFGVYVLVVVLFKPLIFNMLP